MCSIVKSMSCAPYSKPPCHGGGHAAPIQTTPLIHVYAIELLVQKVYKEHNITEYVHKLSYELSIRQASAALFTNT